MITAIEIENLRGIRSGSLEDLAPLTILTGPNASGKSTILDALLIAANPGLGGAVGQAVQRHPLVGGGAKWLFGPDGTKAVLRATTNSRASWPCRLQWYDTVHADLLRRITETAPRPYSSINAECGHEYSDETKRAWIVFGHDNHFEFAESGAGESTVSSVRLIDSGLPEPLHRKFTNLSRSGRREDVYRLLAMLIPDFEQLEIQVEDDDSPSLFITCDGRSVPLGLAGDGVQAFVQLAMDLAVAPDGLALIEEPEVYQHPKTFWQIAQVLLANLRRGIQIVLTTHSQELIDTILSEATEKDIAQTAVFNLLLEDGKLKSGRRLGEAVTFARQTLGNDLR